MTASASRYRNLKIMGERFVGTNSEIRVTVSATGSAWVHLMCLGQLNK